MGSVAVLGWRPGGFRWGRPGCPVHLTFWIVGCVLLLVLPVQDGMSQEGPVWDEIPVSLNVERIGGTEISALTDGQTVLLNFVEVFEFLKIKVEYTPGFDTIRGFFLNPQSTYLVDREKREIHFQGKIYPIPPGELMRNETGFFLAISHFGSIFGLVGRFNVRSLSVNMASRMELPLIREMRLEQIRRNIDFLKGEMKVDTFLISKNPFVHFGMADWSLISSQQFDGTRDNRLNFSLGGLVGGGELYALLNFSDQFNLSGKHQLYYWKYVNNRRPWVRQLQFGKINPMSVSSIFSPVVGVQASNTPTTYRSAFGTYTLSDYTEPGWIVELYVNNVLIEFVRADGQGFFTFNVPMVYGNSTVVLKFYGPWGEELTKTQHLSIPFNFLPRGKLEYTAGMGIVEDGLGSRFARTAVQYGVSRRWTLGGGYEYLSSLVDRPGMPFVSSSFRIGSNWLWAGDYTHGVRSKLLTTFQLPGNWQFEALYIRFRQGQKAINFSNTEERKMVISKYVGGDKLSFFSRVTFDQLILKSTRYSTLEWLISGSIYGLTTNLTTNARFASPAPVTTYTNLSFNFLLPYALSCTPSLQYNYHENKLVSVKTMFERKAFSKGMLTLTYEQNFISRLRNVEVGFRYDLNFAQAGFSARNTVSSTLLVESARGSFIYDRKQNYFRVGNRGGVSKGGVLVVPFLDVNCNEIWDAGEPRAYGLVIRATGARIEMNEADTTHRVLDLEAWSDFTLILDAQNFENISWKIRKKVLKMTIDPNQFRLIQVPVSVFAEASGTVWMRKNGDVKGLGRVYVEFIQNDTILVGKVLSESDGYFSFLGLPPGKYQARVNPDQLTKLGLRASPPVEFTIKPSRDGEFVDSLEFFVERLESGKPSDSQPAGQGSP